jgi:hypothetical protein
MHNRKTQCTTQMVTTSAYNIHTTYNNIHTTRNNKHIPENSFVVIFSMIFVSVAPLVVLKERRSGFWLSWWTRLSLESGSKKMYVFSSPVGVVVWLPAVL